MFDAGTKNLTLKFVTLLLLTFGLLLLSKETTQSLLASSHSPPSQAQLPTVSIEPQDDAPLRIISAYPVVPDTQNYSVRVMLQNQSGKKIRALAVAIDSAASGGGRVLLLNLAGADAALLPGQSRTADIYYGQNDSPKGVAVYVDFVEFGDGGVWGRDVNNSRDRLAGQRAGAKIERERLRKLLESKGRPALLSSIEGDATGEVGPATVTKHSEEWLQGFRSGAGAVRHRVREALQTNDLKRLQGELVKPYDTSEGNQL